MSAKQKTVQPKSQATPLAEDVLGFLQGQIGPEGFGPLTALQRQAQNFLGDFLALGPEQLSPLLGQLEGIQQRRTGEQVGDLREAFSIGGGRFGTTASIGEARLREGLEETFGAQLSQLLLAQQGQQITAAGTAGTLAAQNIDPFIQLAGLGILPEEIFFEQNPFVTGLGALAGLAGGAGSLIGGLKGGGGNVPLFGGGQPAFRDPQGFGQPFPAGPSGRNV